MELDGINIVGGGKLHLRLQICNVDCGQNMYTSDMELAKALFVSKAKSMMNCGEYNEKAMSAVEALESLVIGPYL